MYTPVQERSVFITTKERAQTDASSPWVLVLGVVHMENPGGFGCMQDVAFEAIATMLAIPVEEVRAHFACAVSTGKPQVLKREKKEVLQLVLSPLRERICTCRFTLNILAG